MKYIKKPGLLLVLIVIIIGTILFIQSLDNKSNNKNDVVENLKGAPSFIGITKWLNSEPLSINGLKGKVVLVDFWTYSCINCIRTLPHLVEWDKKYRDMGLVIVGVHTPEFEFEKNVENVKKAIEKYGIKYAVAMDNDYSTWKNYDNKYWPHKFLIDKNGMIRYDHIGEGGYGETEKEIQKLLSEEDIGIEIGGIEDLTPISINTPELYAGYDFAIPRGQNLGNFVGLQKNKVIEYELPDTFIEDRIYVEGKWKSNADNLQAIDTSGSKIVLDYIANDVNIVAESLGEPISLRVLIDGKPLTNDMAGDDVRISDGVSIMVVDEARLYNVVKDGYGRHKLELNKVLPGFTFHAFTFG